MSKFTLGVIVGALAALTPFLTPAILVVGVWALFAYGLTPPSDSASAGVMWVSAWTTVLTAILVALTVLVLGLWGAPKATLTAVGTLLALAAVRKRMHRKRGDADGPV